MLNTIWFLMIFIGIVYGIMAGNIEAVNDVILREAGEGVTFTIGLIGIMSLWLGVMSVAEKSGLMNRVSSLFRPVVRLLFPQVPRAHPAERWILMNFIANMFGMGSGATAFGLKAMKELDSLNPHRGRASNSMAMFLIINMSALQLIPLTIIKIRYDYGSSNPTGIVGPTILATTVSTIIAVIVGKIFEGGKS